MDCPCHDLARTAVTPEQTEKHQNPREKKMQLYPKKVFTLSDYKQYFSETKASYSREADVLLRIPAHLPLLMGFVLAPKMAL